MKIQESAEDYLEAILMLRHSGITVRPTDIAQYLNFSKPSVSRALSLLTENGYVEPQRDEGVLLTEAGEAIAQKMYERHRFFSDWLVSLGVSEQVAMQDACRLEHDLSEQTFRKIREYIEKH